MGPKIIKVKVIFAFFSISLLLFGGNALMMTSYSQPQQKEPSRGEQLQPQLQQQLQPQLQLNVTSQGEGVQPQLQQQLQQQLQKQLLPQLQQQLQKQQPQLQQELQSAMQEKGNTISGEITTKKIPNGFELDEEFSVEKVQNILNQTLPSSPLKAKILGPTALRAATENQTLQAQPTINAPPPPAVLLNPPSTQPVSDTGALARGCEPAVPISPGWVTVKPYPYDNVVAQGEIANSRINVVHHDFPFNHKSHDNNFHVIIDPKYNGLASTAVHKTPDGKYNMNQEWEIGTANTGITDRFPKFFWPWEGDRVWMMGKWVYDCMHFSVRKWPLPLFYGYQTEIHPAFATAFTRNEPYQFPGENKPSSARVTYIYIHGRGGSFNTPVGGQNYEFDIPMPPKPCKVFCLPTFQLRSNVIGLPFGGPAPIVTAKSQLCDFGGTMTPCAHVVIPLSGIPKSTGLKYGTAVAVKWIDTTRPTPEPEGLRTLRVTFDSIKVVHDHDYFSGEWNNLWVGVNGKWIELSGPSGHYGLNDVDDGEVIRFPTGTKSVTVTVPESGVLKIITSGWESDPIDDCFGKSITRLLYDYCLGPGSDNDNIGLVVKKYYAADNFGASPPGHAESSIRNPSGGDTDTIGDFNLRYRIEQLAVYPPSQPPVGRLPTAPTQPPVLR